MGRVPANLPHWLEKMMDALSLGVYKTVDTYTMLDYIDGIPTPKLEPKSPEDVDKEVLEKYRISSEGINPDRAGNFDWDGYYREKYGEEYAKTTKQREQEFGLTAKEFSMKFKEFMGTLSEALDILYTKYPGLVKDFRYQQYRKKLIDYEWFHSRKIKQDVEYSRAELYLLTFNCLKETGISDFFENRAKFAEMLDIKMINTKEGQTDRPTVNLSDNQKKYLYEALKGKYMHQNTTLEQFSNVLNGDGNKPLTWIDRSNKNRERLATIGFLFHILNKKDKSVLSDSDYAIFQQKYDNLFLKTDGQPVDNKSIRNTAGTVTSRESSKEQYKDLQNIVDTMFSNES